MYLDFGSLKIHLSSKRDITSYSAASLVSNTQIRQCVIAIRHALHIKYDACLQRLIRI